MQTQELETVLCDIESDRVERTISLKDTDKFCEAICAFSNDMPGHNAPGYLFINANPDGTASAGMITDQLLQNLASIRSDGNIQPMPVMNVQRHTLGGGQMAVIEVYPSEFPPVRYRGRVWIRVGPRKAIASENEERILSERRTDRMRTWDLRPCRLATIQDLELDLFSTTYRQFAISRDVLDENGRDLQVQMASLRFFDLRDRCPTHAGVLLFAKDVLSFVPGAYIQYVRYAGDSQGTDVLLERRLTGDMLTVLRAIDQICDDIANARPIPLSTASEQIVFEYPPKCLHELMVNAVIHRNYESSTTPVMINHFADRIEILNPGGLYGDLSQREFPKLTAYRNPVIAEAAKTLGFVNKFGRGVDIAQEQLRRNGSQPAEFTIEQNYFLVSVKKRP